MSFRRTPFKYAKFELDIENNVWYFRTDAMNKSVIVIPDTSFTRPADHEIYTDNEYYYFSIQRDYEKACVNVVNNWGNIIKDFDTFVKGLGNNQSLRWYALNQTFTIDINELENNLLPQLIYIGTIKKTPWGIEPDFTAEQAGF